MARASDRARLYFAYGSNLQAERLSGRVGAVAVLGPARLEGRGFAFNKRGRDGSGKANLVEAPDDAVWGALYRLRGGQLDVLDGFEGGYTRVTLVVRAAGALQRAETYVSERLIEDPRPFDWYKQLVVDGALAHGLPEAWLARLRAWPERPDSRGE